MILRKPFAILIKYFKLIHLILTILSFYLLYRTNLILSFFNEYVKTHNSVIGKDLTGELYTIWMYVSLIIVIVGSFVILGLMIFKKKQIKLYIYNIITYLAVTVIYIYTLSVLSSLEIQLVDVRVLKVVQDLLITSFVIQLISTIIVAIRATGFNIKKFDFSKDLKELEIEDVDNEEFEVNVDLNSDETKRKFNRILRHTKYIYKENKFVLLFLLFIAIGIGSISIYLNVGVYNKIYVKGEAFSTTYFTMQLGEAYSSNTDYRGNVLYEEESLLMIHVNIRKNIAIEKEFDSARLILEIDEHKFHHQTIYDEQLFDIGNIYKKQDIPTSFTDYVFVYKVPTDFLDEEIRLVYTDYNGKEIKLKLNSTSLLGNIKETEHNIMEVIDLKESVLKDTQIRIDSLLVGDVFRVDYEYCLEVCYPSYEYIRPTISGNVSKTLLKINGQILGEGSSNYENLSSFIKSFGYLEYQIEGQTKMTNLNTKTLLPAKTTVRDEYYIEVPREVSVAEKMNLVFKIRNKTYKYIVK